MHSLWNWLAHSGSGYFPSKNMVMERGWYHHIVSVASRLNLAGKWGRCVGLCLKRKEALRQPTLASSPHSPQQSLWEGEQQQMHQKTKGEGHKGWRKVIALGLTQSALRSLSSEVIDVYGEAVILGKSCDKSGFYSSSWQVSCIQWRVKGLYGSDFTTH